MGKANLTFVNVDMLGLPDSIFNTTFIEAIGNKTDVANNTVGVASLIGLLRYIVDNALTDAEVATLFGTISTAGHTGAVDTGTTIIGYIKQLVTQLLATDVVADTILVDTNELQTDWTNGGRLDLLLDAVKAITDVLPDSGALTSIAQELTLGTPVADVSTDIANVQTDTTTIIASNTAGVPQVATVTSVDGSVTPWTVAPHRLFTATGLVEIIDIVAVVTETVVEGAGADNTLSIGTTDDVDLMIGVTAGDVLVTNDIWSKVAGTSLASHDVKANDESFRIRNTDIDIDVLGTNSITDGTIVFYCTWKPISVGASLVAAIWD